VHYVFGFFVGFFVLSVATHAAFVFLTCVCGTPDSIQSHLEHRLQSPPVRLLACYLSGTLFFPLLSCAIHDACFSCWYSHPAAFVMAMFLSILVHLHRITDWTCVSQRFPTSYLLLLLSLRAQQSYTNRMLGLRVREAEYTELLGPIPANELRSQLPSASCVAPTLGGGAGGLLWWLWWWWWWWWWKHFVLTSRNACARLGKLLMEVCSMCSFLPCDRVLISVEGNGAYAPLEASATPRPECVVIQDPVRQDTSPLFPGHDARSVPAVVGVRSVCAVRLMALLCVLCGCLCVYVIACAWFSPQHCVGTVQEGVGWRPVCGAVCVGVAHGKIFAPCLCVRNTPCQAGPSQGLRHAPAHA